MLITIDLIHKHPNILVVLPHVISHSYSIKAEPKG